MDTYGIEEARSKLGDLIDRVRIGGERIVITRHGKPAVVLVNVDQLAEMRKDLGETDA